MYFQTNTFVSPLPEPIIHDESSVEKAPPGFIQCPITLIEGVPYVVFCAEPIKIANDTLRALMANPLLFLSLFGDLIDKAIGSYFCTTPSNFEYKDPKTRRHFRDEDGTVLVLPLGTDQAPINYANAILYRVLFNDYKVVDPDLVFMAIWYRLKYKTAREDLKELLEPIEKQLKARFEKEWNLALGNNAFENLNKAPKWACVWYVINELVYLKQDDQKHSATIKYLSHIYVLYAFLNDIYGIDTPESIKNYLKKYNSLKVLAKCYNTSDKSNFWRIIRSIMSKLPSCLCSYTMKAI